MGLAGLLASDVLVLTRYWYFFFTFGAFFAFSAL